MINIVDNFKTVKKKDQGFIIIAMDQYIRDIGQRIFKMDLEF